MSEREQTFAALLAVSCLLLTAGVAWFSIGAALVVSGLLLAGWSWLLLAGDETPEAPAVVDDFELLDE